MSARLRGNIPALGAAYHELFLGEDTDEAAAAAVHFAETLERIRVQLLPADTGGQSVRTT